ncbi:MAG: pyridoxal-phosphate dependent enzyme [Bacteroidetes bacterium]|nr:pyridoxal-phosphate dependent enzyme [Bacteroidota bacterium]
MNLEFDDHTTQIPIRQIADPIFEEKHIEVSIYLDYLNHPRISGNKWRKMMFNLKFARDNQYKTLVTMGGAYSNHIYAVANAGAEFGLRTIGILRGEEPNHYGYTLRHAKAMNMELEFVSRENYRAMRANPSLISEKFPDAFFLPEGGTNDLALLGFESLIQSINIPYDYLAVPVGTGGTLAGISKYSPHLEHLGFMSVRDASLHESIRVLSSNDSFQLIPNFDFGGYAKTNKVLIDFINDFYVQYQIPLDPIYTGKMMYGIFELAKRDFFKEGSSIIAIHTGGLQGILGYNEQNPHFPIHYSE